MITIWWHNLVMMIINHHHHNHFTNHPLHPIGMISTPSFLWHIEIDDRRGQRCPCCVPSNNKEAENWAVFSFNSFFFGKIYKMREQVSQGKEIPVFSANFKAGYLDHRHRGVQLLKWFLIKIWWWWWLQWYPWWCFLFFQFSMLKHSCLKLFLFLHSFKETIEDGCDYISFWWIFCSNPIQYKIDVIALPYCYQDWCKIWKWPENKFDESYLFFALIISNMKSNK